MKNYANQSLKHAVVTWSMLVIEIVIISALYALLNMVGVPKNTSIFVSLITTIVLVVFDSLLASKVIMKVKETIELKSRSRGSSVATASESIDNSIRRVLFSTAIALTVLSVIAFILTGDLALLLVSSVVFYPVVRVLKYYFGKGN